MRTRWRNALDHPGLFRLTQCLLAPGAVTAVTRQLLATLGHLPSARLVLDVGCGPSSWLLRVGLWPVGVDVAWPYLREYARGGALAVLASAEALPFRSGSFDAVWSIGLLHHLPDGVAATAIAEMVRVCKPSGYVGVFDAVLPYRPWPRFLAHLIRRFDRGRFMRSEPALRRLLADGLLWQCRRFTYALTGLEGVICWSRPLGHRRG